MEQLESNVLYKTTQFKDNNAMIQPKVAKINKIDAAVRTYRVITADDNGQLPTRIMLIQAGEWPDSVKGNLSITQADLHQMKMNFDSGIARPGQGLGLPIDFSHNEWDQAAAWIDGLTVEGDALFADPVDWTEAGKQAVMGKMFKCVSPSFYPAGRGGWQDPENLETSVDNVLVGAGLTNIPFFKKLSPVKASSLSETDEGDNIIYINQSVIAKETKNMTIDEVRVKDAASLSADEKAFITANHSELSADEKTKFGIVTASAEVAGTAIDPADAKILADIRSGAVKVVAANESVIDASRLASLEEVATQFKTEKAASVVASHVKRGAIKADQADRWTNRLIASTGDARKDLEDDLTSLPSNESIGQELGSSEESSVFADTRAEIASKAGDLIKAAAAKGETLDYVSAQNQVLASDPSLASRDRNENKF
jgi:polyhydroxyalkanoate synthesis regulator phasin